MKTKYSSLFSLPYLIWSLIFIIVPMGLVVVFAFTTEGGQFTLDYVSQVGEYTNVLVRSVWLAAIATIICLLIGYPLAFIMSRMPGFQQRTMLMLIMLLASASDRRLFLISPSSRCCSPLLSGI